MAAYMTYFGCSPRKGSKGGVGAKYEGTITAPGLSAPPEIASHERKKDGDQKERRFWLKVWCKVRGRREGGESGRRRERRRKKEYEGDVSRIVFHLCVVDVLINSVRFSFWRPHGVFHADSGE